MISRKPALRAMIALMFVVGLAVPGATAWAGERVEIDLKDGSTWRGELSDAVTVTYRHNRVDVEFQGTLIKDARLYVQVNGHLAGHMQTRTIFKSDIVSVTSDAENEADDGDDVATPTPTLRRGGPTSRPSLIAEQGQTGLFYLPLKGMVGTYIRHEEIEAIGEEADRYGPGQIIVLELETGGGAVVEMEQIARVMKDIKQRHRMIAWIKEAISAGCATAIQCDEIYFMTGGAAGSMTMYSGTTAVKDKELDHWLQTAGEWMENGGRSRYIAHAMVTASKELSYDRNPDTGEVTFHNDLTGEFVLSRKGENLTFNAENAAHCGFADGIADTRDELARSLDLSEWRLVSDEGERIADDWYDTVKRAEKEIPRLIARRGYKGSSGTAEQRIGTMIGINQELIRWWDRCPNVAQMMLPPQETLKRENDQMRKQLADMKRNG